MKDKMKHNELSGFKVIGHMVQKEINRETGDEKIVVDEKNIITNEGMAELMKRLIFSDGTAEATGNNIHTIALGNDTGSGDLFIPEPPTAAIKATNQSVVYTVPNADMNFNFNTPYEVELSTVLNGTQILDANFPTQVDMQYCSACMLLTNGKSYAYKRFPVRSLSRLIDIQISWTISVQRV